MIAAKRPMCPKHQAPADFFCFFKDTERVCEKCFAAINEKCSTHRENIVTEGHIVKHINQNSKKQVDLATTAFARHRQLTNLATKAYSVYAQDEDDLLKMLTSQLQKEKLAIREKMNKTKPLKNQVKNVQKQISYFKSLKQNNLIELKIKMSSPKGFELFRKKCQNFANLSTKSSVDELKEIYVQQISDQGNNDQAQPVLLSKIKDLLAKFTSKRVLHQFSRAVDGAENDNKQNSQKNGSPKSIKAVKLNKHASQQSIEQLPSRKRIPEQTF